MKKIENVTTMKITNIEAGVLSELLLYSGDVKIDHDKSQEAYDLLEDEIPEGMVNSPELWSGEFTSDNKLYAIVGDGTMKSSGEYILAEIIK